MPTASELARSAILGNPTDPLKRPARSLLVQAFEQIDENIVTAAAGIRTFSAWTDLAAVSTGLVAGQTSYVKGDAGTHTDPVVGGTVSNSGEFSWSTSPAGWERIGDVPLSAAAVASDLAAFESSTAGNFASVNAAAAAETAARVAGDLNLQASIGELPTFTVETYGSIASNSATAGDTVTYGNNLPLPTSGVLTEVSARLASSAASTGRLLIVKQDGTVVKTFDVSSASATPVWTDFGGYIMPAGADVFYEKITGAHLRYVSGVGGCRYFASSEYSGSLGDTVPLSALGATMALSYKVSVGDTIVQSVDRARQIGAASGGEDPAAITARTMGTTVPDSANLVTGQAAALVNDVDRPGIATRLNIRAAAVSTGYVWHLRQVDGKYYKIIQKYAVQLLVGVNPINAIKGASIKRGDTFAYEIVSGSGPRYTTTNGVVWRSFLHTGSPAVGDVLPITYWSSPLAIIAMDLEYETLADTIPAAPPTNGMVNGPLLLTSERFAATPATWVLGSAFSISGGLRSQGSADWDSVAVYDSYSSMFRKRLAMRVRIDDDASIFGLCTQPWSGATNGCVAMVDCVAGKLRIYFWDGTSTDGTLGIEDDLPPIVEGREYVLTVEKQDLNATVTFKDTITLAEVELVDTWAGGARRHWHGRPGVMHLAGDVTTKWFDVHADYPGYLRAIVLGDSNTEGTASNSTHPSWAQLLATGRSDILVAARAGDTSTHLLTRAFSDILKFRPEYVVIAIGTNDATEATWKANVGALILMAEYVGAEPVLCTLIPKEGGQTLINTMNSAIRAGYFGAYRYIDMARAVSDGNDGSTWNVAYRADGAHMNTAGQAKAYEQVLADAPFLAE